MDSKNKFGNKLRPRRRSQNYKVDFDEDWSPRRASIGRLETRQSPRLVIGKQRSYFKWINRRFEMHKFGILLLTNKEKRYLLEELENLFPILNANTEVSTLRQNIAGLDVDGNLKTLQKSSPLQEQNLSKDNVSRSLLQNEHRPELHAKRSNRNLETYSADLFSEIDFHRLNINEDMRPFKNFDKSNDATENVCHHLDVSGDIKMFKNLNKTPGEGLLNASPLNDVSQFDVGLLTNRNFVTLDSKIEVADVCKTSTAGSEEMLLAVPSTLSSGDALEICSLADTNPEFVVREFDSDTEQIIESNSNKNRIVIEHSYSRFDLDTEQEIEESYNNNNNNQIVIEHGYSGFNVVTEKQIEESINNNNGNEIKHSYSREIPMSCWRDNFEQDKKQICLQTGKEFVNNYIYARMQMVDNVGDFKKEIPQTMDSEEDTTLDAVSVIPETCVDDNSIKSDNNDSATSEASYDFLPERKNTPPIHQFITDDERSELVKKINENLLKIEERNVLDEAFADVVGDIYKLVKDAGGRMLNALENFDSETRVEVAAKPEEPINPFFFDASVTPLPENKAEQRAVISDAEYEEEMRQIGYSVLQHRESLSRIVIEEDTDDDDDDEVPDWRKLFQNK